MKILFAQTRQVWAALCSNAYRITHLTAGNLSVYNTYGNQQPSFVSYSSILKGGILWEILKKSGLI